MKRLTVFKVLLIAAMAFATIPVISNMSAGAREHLAVNLAGKDAAYRPPFSVMVPRMTREHPAKPQDDRYDRRRAYWEERLERELDDEESLNGDDDETSAKDTKDSKAKKDEADTDDDSADKEHDEVEQRRDYWRKRLEKEW